MAKRVVYNELEPEIGVVLAEIFSPNGSPLGWAGPCTQCGRTIHAWREEVAAERAQRHVDRYTAPAVVVLLVTV